MVTQWARRRMPWLRRNLSARNSDNSYYFSTLPWESMIQMVNHSITACSALIPRILNQAWQDLAPCGTWQAYRPIRWQTLGDESSNQCLVPYSDETPMSMMNVSKCYSWRSSASVVCSKLQTKILPTPLLVFSISFPRLPRVGARTLRGGLGGRLMCNRDDCAWGEVS